MSREINHIAAYLRTRPIAPVLAQSNESEGLRALKVMLVLDHEMERIHMYERIQSANSETLLMQLMLFHTFQSFKFYDYNVRKEIKTFALQCTACGLLGPCAYILSHMAINHNLHIGLKMCSYCDRVELQKHLENKTLDRCYRNYLRDRNIIEWDTNVCKIVAEFYEWLKKFAEKISNVTTRHQNYAAKRTRRRLNSVSIASSILDEEFNQIKAVLNVPKRPRIDIAGTSQENGVDGINYLLKMSNEAGNTGDDDDDDDDDDVMFVGEIKTEPPLDIQASQDEPTTSGMYCGGRGRDSPMIDSVSTALLLPPTNNFERNDAERFGLFVAQSLSKLPTDIQRRKLEIQIETAILNAKKAAFQ